MICLQKRVKNGAVKGCTAFFIFKQQEGFTDD